jgi:hypothetical protein
MANPIYDEISVRTIEYLRNEVVFNVLGEYPNFTSLLNPFYGHPEWCSTMYRRLKAFGVHRVEAIYIVHGVIQGRIMSSYEAGIKLGIG